MHRYIHVMTRSEVVAEVIKVRWICGVARDDRIKNVSQGNIGGRHKKKELDSGGTS